MPGLDVIAIKMFVLKPLDSLRLANIFQHTHGNSDVTNANIAYERSIKYVFYGK